MAPLEGIRVLDLSRLLPGAVATQYLLDCGAEVIKLEPPVTGDYGRQLLATSTSTPSPLFEATNRGKKSVVINLKNDIGRQIFLRLAAVSDVVVESFRPGVMARLGLDYEQLRSVNQKLIYTAITGYGQSGPHRGMAGHDLNYLAMAGVLDLIGSREEPVVPGVQIADLAGGAMPAIIATLLGLLKRERSGEGQFVDINITYGSASLLVFQLAYQQATKIPSERNKGILSGGYACYNVYRCKGDRWITVAALEEKFWAAFCREIGRPDLIGDQFVDEPRQSKVKETLATIFSKRTAAEWFALLSSKDCCVAPVRTVAEAAELLQLDPKCIAMVAGMSPVARPVGSPPELGQHTADILVLLGYNKSDMEEFKRRGAIG